MSDVNLSIDKTLVEGVLRERIAAAVARELGSADQLIQNAIEMALSQKVNRDGKVGNYSSDNKYSFIEAVAGNAVRQAAREAIHEWVNSKKDVIKAAVEKNLNSQRSKIARALVERLSEPAGRSNLEVKINVLDDRNY